MRAYSITALLTCSALHVSHYKGTHVTKYFRKRVVNFAPRLRYPREKPAPMEQEVVCVTEPLWTIGIRENTCLYRESNPGPSAP
jgi:hypothetical protein